MPQAVIGSPFTFQVLFLDPSNAPVVVTAPVIDVFSFSAAGAKNLLVQAQPLTPVTPPEVGRYVYTYAVPTSFSDGDVVYAEYRAMWMGSQMFATETVTLIADTRARAGYHGLIARVV